MMRNNDLLKQLSATSFVMWDLHLYLDTHTCDTEAIALYNKYKEKYHALRDEFEENCWKLTSTKAQGVEWIKNPWPWEKESCDC